MTNNPERDNNFQYDLDQSSQVLDESFDGNDSTDHLFKRDSSREGKENTNIRVNELNSSRVTPADRIQELKDALDKLALHQVTYQKIETQLVTFVEQAKKATASELQGNSSISIKDLYIKVKLPVLMNPLCFIEAEYRLAKDTIVSLGQGFFQNISIFEMLERIQTKLISINKQIDVLHQDIEDLERDLFRGTEDIDELFDRLEEEERLEEERKRLDSGDVDQEFEKFFVKNDQAARKESRILLAETSSDEEIETRKLNEEVKDTAQKKHTQPIKNKQVTFSDDVQVKETPRPTVPLHMPAPQTQTITTKSETTVPLQSSIKESKPSAPVIQDRITEKSTAKPPSIPSFPGMQARNPGAPSIPKPVGGKAPPTFPTFPGLRNQPSNTKHTSSQSQDQR